MKQSKQKIPVKLKPVTTWTTEEIKELRSRCNYLAYGHCRTHACLRRAGWKPGTPSKDLDGTCLDRKIFEILDL
jgi:hypothetical protein